MCYQPGVHHCHRCRRRSPSSLSCQALATSWGPDKPPTSLTLARPPWAWHTYHWDLSTSPLRRLCQSPFALVHWAFHAGLCASPQPCVGSYPAISALFLLGHHVFTIFLLQPHGHHFGLWAPLHTPLPSGLLSLGFFLFEVSHTILTLRPLPPPHHQHIHSNSAFLRWLLFLPCLNLPPSFWDCSRA